MSTPSKQPAAKPSAKRAAASRKGAAARAEVAARPAAKQVEFRGHTFTLPDELPATLLFDITDLEVAGNDPMPVFRLLRSLLGPDQFTELRNLVAGDEQIVHTIDELIEDLFAQYGVSLGERSASPGS